jgi:thiol:disulfide interchange protein
MTMSPRRILAAFILMATLMGIIASAFAGDDRFIGLRHANPGEIRTALPTSLNRLTVIDFSSVLCLDCQKMKPVLQKFRTTHPQLNFLAIDVNEGPRKQPALMHTFKPLTVPALVFINAKGQITDVLYNYQPLARVESAYQTALKPALVY